MTMPVHDISYKIPLLEAKGGAGSYKEIPIDFDDPRHKEPLVDLATYNVAIDDQKTRGSVGNKSDREYVGGATERVWARKTVAEKLSRVDRFLRQHSLELLVQDAYRPLECQKAFWDYFTRRAQREKPNATSDEIRKYIITFVSDPSGFDPVNPKTWPVHITGGAIDVVMRDHGTHTISDLGDQDMSELSYSDAYERKLVEGEIPENHPRLQNRRLLHFAMTQEGFVNYPSEYWHFDYGDQMYVKYASNRPKAAWYGYMPNPESN